MFNTIYVYNSSLLMEDVIAIGVIYGFFFALVYFTLYRVIERRLPACLRTETRNLTWRDLLIPGIVSGINVVAGILIIR